MSFNLPLWGSTCSYYKKHNTQYAKYATGTHLDNSVLAVQCYTLKWIHTGCNTANFQSGVVMLIEDVETLPTMQYMVNIVQSDKCVNAPYKVFNHRWMHVCTHKETHNKMHVAEINNHYCFKFTLGCLW